jgi:hypothetical protein
MPSKFLRIVLIAIFLFVLIQGLKKLIESDEAKITRAVETMVSGFNDRNLAAVLGGLDPGFLDAVKGHGYEDVQRALQYFFLTEYDAQNKQFLYRARLVASSLSIEVNESQSADVAVAVTIEARRGKEWNLYWPLEARGKMAETERGWVWTRIEEINHAQRSRR